MKEVIRRILREETKPNPYIIAMRRRLPLIPRMRRHFTESVVDVCGMPFDIFYEAFEYDILDSFRLELFDDVSNSSNKDWVDAMDFLLGHLRENHYEWMKEYYDMVCS
jgi:hypothetical protein